MTNSLYRSQLDGAGIKKMQFTRVPGKNKKHRVLLYALSTCGWCIQTKKLLKNNNIEYEYIDVDRCDLEDRELIRRDILSRCGRLSFPTLIVDNSILIIGYQESKIKETLGI